MADIVGIITGCAAILGPIAAGLVWGWDRNKKWKEIKIAEAKEKSAGAEAIKKIQEDQEEYQEKLEARFEAFKIGVSKILFNTE